MWFSFKGNLGYVFDPSPFLQQYMTAKCSLISGMILMPIISVFLEVDILSRESLKNLYLLNHIYIFYGRGICQIRKEDCINRELKVVDA